MAIDLFDAYWILLSMIVIICWYKTLRMMRGIEKAIKRLSFEEPENDESWMRRIKAKRKEKKEYEEETFPVETGERA